MVINTFSWYTNMKMTEEVTEDKQGFVELILPYPTGKEPCLLINTIYHIVMLSATSWRYSSDHIMLCYVTLWPLLLLLTFNFFICTDTAWTVRLAELERQFNNQCPTHEGRTSHSCQFHAYMWHSSAHTDLEAFHTEKRQQQQCDEEGCWHYHVHWPLRPTLL